MTIPILIAAAIWLAQQAPPQPRVASVEGTVVNTLNSKGIARATVILRSRDAAEGTSYADETDGDGHFRISDVAPGDYEISADRQSFFPQPNGAPGAPMPRFTVAAGERVANVMVKLTPTGVITGRVLDQDGEPIAGAQVQAMQYANVGGKPLLRGVAQVQSKAKGEYRLFGLRPGSYRLQVSGRSTRDMPMGPQQIRGPHAPMGSSATFFPSAADAASAVVVDLKAGAELTGFDITMRGAVAEHTVRVKYSPADNVSFSPALRANDSRRVYGPTFSASGDTLVFSGVLPGSYVLFVTRVEGEVRTYARQQVEVSDADVDAGTLTFSPPANIEGTVRVEAKPAPPLRNLRLFLQPESPSEPGSDAELKPDGSFVWKEVIPGMYQVALRPPEGLYVKSLRSGDEDLPDLRLDATRGQPGPLAIVLRADVGQIEGAVAQADGNPAARVRVTMFPDGSHAGRSDLFKFGFTDDQGKYHFDKVPPGEYRLFAWQDVQPGGPQDPDIRSKFEKQSVEVKLAPNGHETVPLTAIVTKTEAPSR